MKRFGDTGPALHRAGWDIVPIKTKTKRALEDEWQHGFTIERIEKWALNGYANGSIGLLARKFPGGDIDVSDEVCAQALEALMLRTLGPAPVRVGSWPKRLLMYITSAPFKKVKIFLTGPDGDKGPDGKDYAIEFLGDGQQYLIYGEHPDGFEYRWPQGGGPGDSDIWDLTEITRDSVAAFEAALPAALPAGWSVRSRTGGADSSADGLFENYKAPLDGWGDLAKVEAEVLVHMDPDCDYEEWLKVGAALHHQSGGDPDWLAAWDAWSAGSAKYEEGLCERKWDSFTANRASASVTLASLLHTTKDARGAQATAVKVSASEAHRAALLAAPDEAALRAVAALIAADADVDRLGRETLAATLRTRLGAVLGATPGIAIVRGLVAPPRAAAPVARLGGPEWVQPWCYVTGQAKFFNRTSKALITREAFDAAHCRFMEPGEDGQVPSAAKVACDNWQVPVVDGVMYLPNLGELFSVDGRDYANMYRPESVPLSVNDAVAFSVLMRHFELTVPSPEYRAVLLRWAAWIVRNPGLKVLWAVLIKGVEGDGKSLIGNMLGQAMGYENVGVISPETLAGSNFNDWAVGRCVNVIEELKMPGHNRNDAYNKIKPLITNPRIEVHGKGKASATAVNTTNYLAFTNHTDALPLDDKDRRNFILFTPWRDISEMHLAIEALGLTVDQYWDAVWGVVKNQPDAVRAFFESIDIAGFDPNSRAPASEFKDLMVQAGDLDDAEAYAKHFLEAGCYGVSKSVVSSACLTRALAELNPPVQLHTSKVRKLMEGLGMAPVKRIVWWAGAPHRLHISSDLTNPDNDTLRGLLDKTVTNEMEDFLK